MNKQNEQTNGRNMEGSAGCTSERTNELQRRNQTNGRTENQLAKDHDKQAERSSFEEFFTTSLLIKQPIASQCCYNVPSQGVTAGP